MNDLIIVGAGPAGLTASIYASRYKLKNKVIGKLIGGTMTLAHKVENIPGFLSISGLDWAQKVGEQVKNLGVEILGENVVKIEKTTTGFKVITESKKEIEGKALLVAIGTERRRLDVPGEKEYLGKGVSYCTTCDAPFFRNKRVALIGGADAAVAGAVHTAEFAQKVYIVYRRDKLRAEPIWLEEWKKTEEAGKGATIYNTNITEILGDNSKVTGVKLDKPYQEKDILELDGVFIEVGGVPATSLLAPLGVKLTEANYVQVTEVMETSLPGLFAAGDITDKSVVLTQAITAMAQGAIAAASAYKYLKGEKAPQILGTEESSKEQVT